MTHASRRLLREVLLTSAAATSTVSAAAAVPAGFLDEVVASVPSPTAVAFVPDGRILVTTQAGSLRVYCQNNTAPGCTAQPAGGGLLTSAALTFPTSGGSNGALKPAPICANSERGLLGVAVDPAFATNRHIYLFYSRQRFDPSGFLGSWQGCTSPKAGYTPVNRVSRFTFGAGTSTVSAASEVVLLDGMPSTAGNHNAGDLKLGKDGYLYVSIGDGGCDYASDSGCGGSNDAARDTHTLTGKLLRIGVNADGSTFIPPANPFVGSDADLCSQGNDLASPPTIASTTPGRKCRETFAWGLRNPFRFAMDPNTAGTTTRLFINDVGQNAREEVNLGQSGADYGWPCREGSIAGLPTGKCSPSPAGMVDPVFDYSHSASLAGQSGCGSITGAAFAPTGYWPSTYDGHFFFADYNCGAIFHLTQATPAVATVAWSLGGSSATSLAFDPFGTSKALYYTSYASGGQLHRIRPPTTGNHVPVAVASGAPLFGPAPLTVTFSAAGSGDADAGDSLTYFWTFGDGAVETSTTSLTIQHTYAAPGTFTASLRVRDSHLAFSAPATVVIHAGNTPPVPAIATPAQGATFAVGSTITLTGSASDLEDGALGASALSWTVLLHHDAHTHPFFGPATGNNLTFTAPAPEDLPAAATSYLEIILIATDSEAAQGVARRDLQPRKVDVNLATNPPGLTLLVQSLPVTTPHTAISWEGYSFPVAALDQTGGTTESYRFSSWSDGGAATHTITTPASPPTLTATFASEPTPGAFSFVPVSPCRLLDTRSSASPLANGSPRTFHVGPACAIPLTAKSVSVNIVGVSPTGGGYLSFVPAGGTGTTSAVNFRLGQTRANNAVVPLDAGSVFTVTATLTGTVHLIVDLNGYFE